MRVLPTLLLILLAAPSLLAPLAAAEGPVRVSLPQARVGDVYRFAWRSVDPDDAADGTLLVHVEGIGEIADAYGVLRPAEQYRIDLLIGSGVDRSERCAMLLGGQQALRRDASVGHYARESVAGSTGMALGPLDMREDRSFQAEAEASFEPSGCQGRPHAAGRSFEEGQRVPLEEVFPVADPSRNLLSAPAEAATFHGRPALRLRYEGVPVPWAVAFNGSLELLLADGLAPHAGVLVSFGSLRVRLALVGVTEGTGGTLPVAAAERLPPSAPGATLPPRDPIRFDDRALGLPFPYEEALQAALDDPDTGLAKFLDAHPTAFLHEARYERAMGGREEGDGGWSLAFTDGGDAARWARVTRQHSVATPLGLVALPEKRVDARGGGGVGGFVVPQPVPHAPALADAETVLRTAQAQGFDVRRLERVEFRSERNVLHVGVPVLRLASMSRDPDAAGSAQALAHDFDLSTGGAFRIYHEARSRTAPPLLARPPDEGAGLAGAEASRGRFLSMPLPGSGLGVATAAAATLSGAALLALLAFKLLLPLHTRLRRARLLENPVRAALMDRIRREPGVHLGALVEAAGIGSGATRHHLSQLQRHGFVTQLRQGGYLRYFPAGAVPPEAARREAVLLAGSHRAVYDHFLAHPDAGLRRAAADLGLSAPSVHLARRKLRKEGLLPFAEVAKIPISAQAKAGDAPR